jgi:chromosomal replication initiation ATPase DnaA
MGQAKSRANEIARKIKKRQRFVYLCKKYTRHSEREILTALKVREWEGKL